MTDDRGRDSDSDKATLYGQAAQSAATILGDLAEIESMIGELQRHIDELPFFARGFVSSQVTKGTGQDVPAWGATVSGLAATLRQVRDAAGHAAGGHGLASPAGATDATDATDADARALYARARAQIDADRPRLERLAAFMESVPAKLGAIPPGLLPADQRAEFLATVAQQTRALRGALASMPALCEQLLAISD